MKLREALDDWERESLIKFISILYLNLNAID